MNLDHEIERIYRDASGTKQAIAQTKKLITQILESVKPKRIDGAPFYANAQLDEMEANVEKLGL